MPCSASNSSTLDRYGASLEQVIADRTLQMNGEWAVARVHTELTLAAGDVGLDDEPLLQPKPEVSAGSVITQLRWRSEQWDPEIASDGGTLVEQVLNQLVALVIGLILGFFFERRTGRETREQNRELRAELNALRSSVYTVGGSERPRARESSLSPDKLLHEVVTYAKATQNAEGRVRKSLLIEHFTSNGYLPGSVNQALDLAQESGALSLNETWVIIP